MIGWISIGFILGICVSAAYQFLERKYLLDKTSWEELNDFYFKKWQRDQRQKISPFFKLPRMDFLTKVKAEPDGRIKLDAKEVSDRVGKQVAETQEKESLKELEAYLKFKKDAHEANVSVP